MIDTLWFDSPKSILITTLLGIIGVVVSLPASQISALAHLPFLGWILLLGQWIVVLTGVLLAGRSVERYYRSKQQRHQKPNVFDQEHPRCGDTRHTFLVGSNILFRALTAGLLLPLWLPFWRIQWLDAETSEVPPALSWMDILLWGDGIWAVVFLTVFARSLPPLRRGMNGVFFLLVLYYQ